VRTGSRYRRKHGAALFVAGYLCFLHPSSPVVEARPDLPVLRLVGDKDYAPLTYLESGVAKGRDVDIARAVAQRLGRELQLELMDWSEAQRRVLDGDADGLLAMSMTEDRKTQFDFADQAHAHTFGVFVRQGDEGIRTASDVAPGRLGVTDGGYPRRFLTARGMTNLALISNYEDGFRQLNAGTLDAVAADTWVGAYTIQRRHLQNIAIAERAFATLPGGLAFRKGNTALTDDVNRALRSMEADGTLSRIQKEWRGQEVLFISRQHVRQTAMTVIGVVGSIVLGVALVWLTTTRKHIRARRRLESDNVNSQHQLYLMAHALQSANDCISITDTADHILYVNEALLRTYEYTEAELIGQHIGILRSGHTEPAVLEEMGAATRREGWRGEVWNQTKTGRVFPVALSTSMVRDESGAVIGAVGVARDVAQERHIEEQLRQSQKMDALGRMAAGLAHDFNNLLTIILGNCADRLQYPVLDTPVRRSFSDISTAAKGAAALTGQLLAFSRQQILQPRELCLNDILHETQPMITRLIGADLDVWFHAAPDLGVIVADAAQIQQLLVNLAVNARDAMPQGGLLKVETRNVTVDVPSGAVPPGDYVMLAVTDTGVGMSDETRARIFEPFFTTKESGKGTGLGLSTVYGTVMQSGGFISVSSEPGRGTTFTIHFPRVEPLEPLPPDDIAIANDAPPPAGVVLLVDDDNGVRETTRRRLEKAGHTVMSAATGEEALVLSRQAPPSLLVTDVRMPGMSGPALAEQLRASHPRMKVLFLSGDIIAAASADPMSLPAGAHFLQKPFGGADLERKVAEMLAGGEMLAGDDRPELGPFTE
jgi:PAS domain S-box-containing protein